VTATVVAAIAGSAVLALRHSGNETTTLGVTATLPVPGHPEALVAGPDAVWVALSGDGRSLAGSRPLVRVDPATGTIAKTVYLGSDVPHLAHIENRLLASLRHPGSGLGELVALDWRSGAVLNRHWYQGPVDELVLRGNDLWALEEPPGTLLQLDPATLEPRAAPLQLSPGRTLALASDAHFLWVTAADTGEVLRIDPTTRAIRRVHVGGSPAGIAVAGEGVWFVDRDGAKVVRLDPRSLRRVGPTIQVGARPSWLTAAGGSLFVADQEDGTVVRIDLHTGKKVGRPIRFARPKKQTTAATVASSGQAVWVGSFPASTLTRLDAAAAGGYFGGDVTVRMEHGNENQQGDKVTNGGIAGIGDFTASGAISDTGKVLVYRTFKKTVKGIFITLRFVTIGKKGTITYVDKIDTNAGTSLWTITSVTKAYEGLHGEGFESENADYTVQTLKGTVSR